MPRFRERPIPGPSGRRRSGLEPQLVAFFFRQVLLPARPNHRSLAYSMIAGFAQHLDAGSQVISLSHTQIVKSNLSVTETFGFIREKAYSTIDQPFTTAQFATCVRDHAAPAPQSAAAYTINTFGSTHFPGISIVFGGITVTLLSLRDESRGRRSFPGRIYGSFPESLQSLRQRHLDAGKAHDHFRRQLRVHPTEYAGRRNQLGTIASPDFTNFLVGNLVPNNVYNVTTLLVGNPNRYWRTNETGEYIQDKFQMRSNLTITAGLRLDWDGGLTEKYGNLFNFDPSKYTTTIRPRTRIVSNGLIVAGNNPNAATPGVSNTTLTGRQWGFAPRSGVAWSPRSSTTN